MAEESSPTSSPAPPASTSVDMDDAHAPTESKRGDATFEENTPPAVEDRNTGEGKSFSLCIDSISNMLNNTSLSSHQHQWRFTG